MAHVKVADNVVSYEIDAHDLDDTFDTRIENLRRALAESKRASKSIVLERVADDEKEARPVVRE